MGGDCVEGLLFDAVSCWLDAAICIAKRSCMSSSDEGFGAAAEVGDVAPVVSVG